MTITSEQPSSVRFCSRSFHALALTPEPPVSGWLTDLDTWLARSPSFFAGKAIVVDVSKLSLTKSEIVGLIASLAARGIRILGMEGADSAFVDADLPPVLMLTKGRSDCDGAMTRTPAKSAPALLVNAPVRSGQSIIHPDGDVTVVGSVASGAEIVAAGSIHIYGTLRGRALGGAYGNPSARIFCRRLQAELLAIDGNYLLADEVPPRLRSASVQVWLDGETLQIAEQE